MVPHPQSRPRQVSQRPPTRPATTLTGGLTPHATVESIPSQTQAPRLQLPEIGSLLARFTKCPNEVIFDTGLNDGEVRVLLALNALDWNEKGWSEHSEETMAG